MAPNLARLLPFWRRPPPPLPPPPPPAAPDVFVFAILLIAAAALVAVALCQSAAKKPGPIATALRLLLWRGSRRKGRLTGLRFPISAAELTCKDGVALLTTMLRKFGHLHDGERIASIHNLGVSITDGVKGDKALLEVEYDPPTIATRLPTRFFVKFNVGHLGPMRVLCETSEVCKCEAHFYHDLCHADATAWEATAPVQVPRCFFVDYSEPSGEFCLVTELLDFSDGSVAPLKHRIRDRLTLDEQRLIIEAGATLNARYWADGSHAASSSTLCNVPRFADTHRRMWWLAQASGLTGLAHTAARTLKGKANLNERFMTWRVPEGIAGRELQLVREMPAIMRALCDEEGLLAFGHNDLLLDNVFFPARPAKGRPAVGLFDWQQACVNNVGQEWAWNFHFLDPAFLDAHEAEMIDLVLATYATHGRKVDRAAFMRAYCLGTAQMFVWGGGGLQLLMGRLHKRGLLVDLEPNDPRVLAPPAAGASHTDPAVHELLLGAEMTRRTFTNCCNIMRRHNFVRLWDEWRACAQSACN